MEVLDMAMQKEQEAEQYYRTLAGKSTDTGLRNILNKLADVELKHYEILQRMQQSGPDSVHVEMDADNYFGAFKTLFRDVSEQVKDFRFDISQVEMYKLARGREAEAHTFYEQQADAAAAPAAKALFGKLATQEQLHYDILNTIIEFVSRPEMGQWLEDAEWYHRDEY